MGCCDRKGIMKFTRVHKAIGIIGAIALAVMGIGQTAEASSQTGASASYDGTTISLASGWGGAAVCAVTESGNYCFASQSAYQNWLTSLVATMPISSSPDTNCSSALDLYSGTNYTGSELSLLDEGVWLNLSAYGFSDKTNSYKVGACEVSMTSAANGGGSVYPGPMTAGTHAPSMDSGWSDRVQSAYIR
jgi:hypothetical protein